MKNRYHETIILFRVPEFHGNSMTFYCVDKKNQIIRSTSTQNSFDAIAQTVMGIMNYYPRHTYGLKVPSPKKAELTKNQIGVLEGIVELHNQGTEAYYLRQKLRKVNSEHVESLNQMAKICLK